MRFIAVDEKEIPKRSTIKTAYKNVRAELNEFMAMNVKAARVIFGDSDYMDRHTLYASFRKTVRVDGFPIKIIMRNGNVYFIRTDL